MSEDRQHNAYQVWWNADKDQAHEDVFGTMLDLIQTTDTERRQDLAAWRAMYMDYPMPDDDGIYARLGFSRYGKSENNVLTGAVEATIASLIATRPKPKVTSIGGDWSIRTRVKLLNQWSDGQWERLGIDDLMDQQVQDAAIFGTGCIKFSPRFGAPHAEMVWCGHLWIDPREEFHKCVKTLYQYAGKDREELAAAYPEHSEAIMDATKTPPMDAALFEYMPSESANTADLVAVVEAWRLPEKKGGKGRHVICVDGADLVDEPWEHDMFPFSFMRWGIDPMRFWGQGMVERGAGPQSELNDLCHTSRESYDQWFNCWLVPEAALQSMRMTDELGRIITYDPAKGRPEFYTPGAIGPEFGNQILNLQDRVRANVGVNAQQASGSESVHEMSGKARLVQKDVHSIRFGREGRQYEKACVDCEKCLLMVADDLADSNDADLDVYGGDKVLEHIEFGKARLSKDTPFRVRVEPVSKMADTMSGKLEQLTIMNELGLVQDPGQMERLLDAPDLLAEAERSQSGRDIVDRAIEKNLDGEEPVPPHTFMDTAYAKQRGIDELNLAEQQGAPEQGLENLRAFISFATELHAKKMQAEAAAMQPPPAPMPDPGLAGAPPPAPPANDMGGAAMLPPAE